MRIWRYISLILFLMFAPSYCIAQDGDSPDIKVVPPVDEETYREVIKDINFDKTKKSLRPKEREVKKRQERKEPFSMRGLVGVFELIGYIVVILLVGALIYFIFGNVTVDKKIKNKEVVDIVNVDDIESLDIQTLLQQALDNEDYRSALRIKFLDILQLLSKKEIIQWKSDKTNRDYSNELRSHSYGKEFRGIARVFEHVWYGKQDIDKAIYVQLVDPFLRFKNMINA